MLVLSRRVQERILIGDNVEIVILRSGPDRVSVGINAPVDVRVLRAEVGAQEDNHRLVLADR